MARGDSVGMPTPIRFSQPPKAPPSALRSATRSCAAGHLDDTHGDLPRSWRREADFEMECDLTTSHLMKPITNQMFMPLKTESRE